MCAVSMEYVVGRSTYRIERKNSGKKFSLFLWFQFHP